MADKLQPCGHPIDCIRADDEGTCYCAWCAELARVKALNADLLAACEAMAQELERAHRALDELWDEWSNEPEQDDLAHILPSKDTSAVHQGRAAIAKAKGEK